MDKKKNLFDYFSPKKQEKSEALEDTPTFSSQNTLDCGSMSSTMDFESELNEELVPNRKCHIDMHEEEYKREDSNKLSGKSVSSEMGMPVHSMAAKTPTANKRIKLAAGTENQHNVCKESRSMLIGNVSPNKRANDDTQALRASLNKNDSSHSSFHDISHKNNTEDNHSRLTDKATPTKAGNDERYSFLQDVRDINMRRKGEPGYDPSTLYIPESEYKKLTPFEKQFWDIKKHHFDTIVFFKKGMFYELYEDDATISSKLFDFQITDRVNMRMSGFPESNYNYWAAKFLENGFKVARVEQSENMIGKMIREEDSRQGKAKIIGRELVEIITQGTIYDGDHIKSPLPIYLLSVESVENRYFVILFDASINKMYFSTFVDDDKLLEMSTIFAQYDIREILGEKHLLSGLKFSRASKVSNTIDTSLVDEAKNLFEDVASNCLDSLFVGSTSAEGSSTADTLRGSLLSENTSVERISTAHNTDNTNSSDSMAGTSTAKRSKYEFENDNMYDRNMFYKCYLRLYSYMSTLKRLRSFRLATACLLSSYTRDMILDSTTIENLELLKNNYDNTDEKTLFKAINNCVSPFGTRLLQKWMLSPLMDKEKIVERQKKANFFYEMLCLDELRISLKMVGDLERYYGRLQSGSPTTRDLLVFMRSVESSIAFLRALRETLSKEVTDGGEVSGCRGKSHLAQSRCSDRGMPHLDIDKSHIDRERLYVDIGKPRVNRERLHVDGEQCYPTQPVFSNNSHRKEVETPISPNNTANYPHCASESAASHSDCDSLISDLENILSVINKSYEASGNELLINENRDEELSSLISSQRSLEGRMYEYLEGVKRDLRCEAKYIHRGKEIFQIEVSSSTKLPAVYAIVSKTKTHNRFYTSELIAFVKEHKRLSELTFQVKGSMLKRVIESMLEYNLVVYRATSYMGAVDCYISFAMFAKYKQTVTPVIIDEPKELLYSVSEMSNPVYPNYVSTDYRAKHKILVLTGPNMGGKSTFLRSICLNIILCQMGMRVCCREFAAPLFDRVFTRIGASDNLLRGESTFMVELSETSKILKYSTPKSFIIVDELGRGTSTKDGECIAKSVLEYLKRMGPYVMFSTHYHNLVKKCEDVDKGFMDTLMDKEDILFLYKVRHGVCDNSHGLYVAKLTGVPGEIIERAKSIRKELEACME